MRRSGRKRGQVVLQVYPRPSKVVRIAKDHYSLERGEFEPVNLGLAGGGYLGKN
jgi:hypothetical protein